MPNSNGPQDVEVTPRLGQALRDYADVTLTITADAPPDRLKPAMRRIWDALWEMGSTVERGWVHGRPGYRCRHGHTSAKPNAGGRPKTLYLRQDRILARIAADLEDSEQLELAAFADGLRAQGITILCDASVCTLVNTSSTGQPQLQLIN
jgi:hypothetical protein